MKTNFCIFALCVGTLAVACGDDPTEPPEPPGPGSYKMPLTTRNAVLNNIEYAYNKRTADVIDELLDDGFSFFFAPGDVGGNIPEQWGRPDEIDATSRLFNSNYQDDPAVDLVCRSIRVDIQFGDETEWTPVSPEDFPGETWYTATVLYTFRMEFEPDMTLIPENGARAQFTVRDVVPGEDERWQLVEWRDLGGASRAMSTGAASETKTWGAVKAIYR